MRPLGINIFDRIKNFFLQKNALSRLMLINIVIWLICLFISVFTWLFNVSDISFVTKLFAVPADISSLTDKPWSIFTYMFLQEEFWHLFFNMLMLYYGGQIFLQYFTQKQLLLTYIFGGLFGALFFIMSFNIFPVFENMRDSAVALGASASVLSILIAAATYQPEYKLNLFLLGEVKMKWIAIIFVVIDLLSIPKGNSGGHIAHLGGALWGFLYAFMLRKDFDIYMIFKRQPRIKVKSRNTDNHHQRPKTDEQYNAERAQEQQEIDKILDKIAKNGYSSLSEKEKEYLFKQSKK
ncbi:MAG: rhomboid family intramembrane serine protease [Bacteroidales bacterium]|nr:rhomboid family intramembrane serine protease [Lentimicrobiaceae bacterium]MBQ2852155.1 rhomboid family intramembrane serine protease [Bacteroidales bacterium]